MCAPVLSVLHVLIASVRLRRFVSSVRATCPPSAQRPLLRFRRSRAARRVEATRRRLVPRRTFVLCSPESLDRSLDTSTAPRRTLHLRPRRGATNGSACVVRYSPFAGGFSCVSLSLASRPVGPFALREARPERCVWRRLCTNPGCARRISSCAALTNCRMASEGSDATWFHLESRPIGGGNDGHLFLSWDERRQDFLIFSLLVVLCGSSRCCASWDYTPRVLSLGPVGGHVR
ncbi:hypothetical protein PHLGIDRAFT_403114 [Phlebiopsis gigantea 11061_1 CR5-6]|uniref:Secreted protein n=1 Tax=Phlebiopsis gigantea (strain 11061_1 CR5-6) TaxID=745531 RepID=A0A0C3PMM9_PHLG1|nr:hypothetical protein PHLGIDRAFT_403114 [Phlebiopsis gigantea 11061_1 CR5-6]